MIYIIKIKLLKYLIKCHLGIFLNRVKKLLKYTNMHAFN